MLNKSETSNASSYQEIGAFWDTHDSTEYGEHVDVEFEVDIKSQRRYFSLDKQLTKKIRIIAGEHGISGETLLNLWVQEKINQLQPAESKNKNLSG